MAEVEFQTEGLSREEKYKLLLMQAEALLDPKLDWVSNAANLSAAIHEVFQWLWVGFYIKKTEKEIHLGPFQGPVACTIIQKGKGVCGAAWLQGNAILVENVEDFPGHIACSALSKSEVVIPIFKEGKFWGVLDIDSENISEFKEQDLLQLQKLIYAFEATL